MLTSLYPSVPSSNTMKGKPMSWKVPGSSCHLSWPWAGMLFLVFALVNHVSAQPCLQAPSGVLSWWPGDGHAEDLVNGHEGSFEGGAAFTSGMVGQAFHLDGVDASIATSLILPSIGTIELWVNPTSLSSPSSAQPMIGTHGIANGNDRLWITSSGPAGGPGMAPNTLVVNLGSCCTNDLVIPNPLSAGIWTHLALTFDYSVDSYQLYVNGGLAASSTAQRSAPTQVLRLGGATSDFGQNFFFHGALDEVTLYQRVLAASEIQAIFAAGSSGKCDPGGSCVGTGSTFLGGRIRDSLSGLVPDVTLTITGPGCRDSVASPTGRYLLPYLGSGTYTVTPTKTGCTFTPAIWTGTLAKRLSLASFSGVCP